MDGESPGESRRWHDNRQELSQLVELLEIIPQQVLPYLMEATTSKADQDYNAQTILKNLKSLGPEKIMALHKMRNNRRSYDKNPHTSKIVSTFFILPEASQDQMAIQILDFSGLLVDYLAMCDSFHLEPDANHFSQMRDLFLAQGPQAVSQFMQTTLQPYYAQLTQPDSIASPQPSNHQAGLAQSQQGLRITGDDWPPSPDTSG